MKLTKFFGLVLVLSLLPLIGSNLPYSRLDWIASAQPYPPPCPATVALEEAPTGSDLVTLRRFRDEIMAASPSGEKYIDLYYQHSPEIVRILLKDADLRSRTALLLRELMPGIHGLLNDVAGQEVVLTPTRIKQIEVLLDEYAKKASPELQATIEKVRKQLRCSEGMTMREAWEHMSAIDADPD